MDECTSALDSQTEKNMLHNLHSLRSKVIMVTHRPEALDGLADIRRADLERM